MSDDKWELVTDGEYVPQPGVDQLRFRYVDENAQWTDFGNWGGFLERRSIDGWRGQSGLRDYQFRRPRQAPAAPQPQPPEPEQPAAVDRGERYQRRIHQSIDGPGKGSSIVVDLADVFHAFGVPYMLGQAVKKSVLPGDRGAKDRLKDLREAAWSIHRQIQIEEARAEGDG